MSSLKKIEIDPVYVKFCNKAKNFPKIYSRGVSIDQLRQFSNSEYHTMTPELPDVVDEEKTIVYKDKKVRLILIRPPYTKHEVLPVVIYYHGGGWTFGSIYSYKKAIYDIAVKGHVAVAFVEYILAPEAKFPGIHEECFAAFRWVVEHGRSIRVDVSMLALCGDSVGANIATSVSLMAKKHGLLNAIKTQILICPCVAPSHKDFESSIQFGSNDYAISLADIQYQEELYFGNVERTKYGFPLMASPNDLHGLPRALVISAEADLLRDETEAYARKLIEAGVPTTSFRALKAVHGYFNIPTETLPYRQTLAMIVSQLNESFKRSVYANGNPYLRSKGVNTMCTVFLL